MSELTIAINSILEASLVANKWKKYRDSVYKLHTLFETDDTKFKDRMALLQKIIKNYMVKHSADLISAVTAIADKEEDPRLAVQFLAAGYELADNKDYTV